MEACSLVRLGSSLRQYAKAVECRGLSVAGADLETDRDALLEKSLCFFGFSLDPTEVPRPRRLSSSPLRCPISRQSGKLCS